MAFLMHCEIPKNFDHVEKIFSSVMILEQTKKFLDAED